MSSPEVSNKHRVSVIRCDDYESANVRSALEKSLSHLGVSFKMGKKVLIKPNLMSPTKPEKAITTHPIILEELCKILKESGSEIFIGESSFHKTEIAFDICRIRPLSQYAKLINFETQPQRIVSFGGNIGNVPLPNILFDVDLVINVAKMKTHSLTGVTLCVKNLYGCIPGAIKQGYHNVLTTPQSFSRFLIQLHNEILPQLNIIDGIIGVEGAGPGISGQPISSGLVIAGVSAFAVDIIASEIMGFKAEDIFTNRYSGLQRIDIEIVGDGHDARLPFEKPLSASIPCFQFFARFIPQSRIDFRSDYCVVCGLCGEKCPNVAISFDSFPTCDNRRCVRCYCCMEACPHGAVYLHEHWTRTWLRAIAKKWSGVMRTRDN